MKKKFLVIVVVVIVFIVIGFVTSPRSAKKVMYDGNSLLISVDGEAATNLPTSGNYYLTGYSCDSANTIVKWDRKSYKLTITDNKKGGAISCDLEFNSSFPLNEAAIGSYVNYEGYGGTVGTDNVACKKNGAATDPTLAANEVTESPNSCLGQNAHEDLDNSNYTYGYCNTANYKFYVTGWRLAYLYSSSSTGTKPVIVSAGSPECINLTTSIGNLVFQEKIHALSLKYCNTNFTTGNCSCSSTNDGRCDVYSGDAWALNNSVFNRITKNIAGEGGGYLYTAIDGAVTCASVYGMKLCGYNNDLIDNGSNYWFAETWNSTSTNAVIWQSNGRIGTGWVPSDDNASHALGIRPVVSLSPSVYVVGGSGTMDEPYEIAINNFSINNGYDYSRTSAVTLRMSAMPGVTQMCISTSSDGCTEYINFADTYSLDLGEDGEKTVYVYYKNGAGEIVASLTESVIVDTVAPSGSSIAIANGASDHNYIRKLTIASTGADYMCLSNTSIESSQCNWVPYKTSYEWALTRGNGTKTIYAYFKDQAGNITGPITKEFTCSDGKCGYAYWSDAYDNSTIYLMRSDGATAIVKTSSTAISWKGAGSQEMRFCGAYARSTSKSYLSWWCVGADNNFYYKTANATTTWTKVSTSAYVDVSQYSYYLYPYRTENVHYGYMVRSDGRNNRTSTSSLYNTSWSYAQEVQMAACTGLTGSRIACIGTNGYYYYKWTDNSTSIWATTTAYSGGTFGRLTSTRNKNNAWIDLYYNTAKNANNLINVIETTSTNIYTSQWNINATASANNKSATLFGNGVKTCTSDDFGTAINNYCFARDGYLYYKAYTASAWTKTSLKYE